MHVDAPRVAFVATHPIQHFCPLYRALTDDGRVRPKVFFASTAGAKAYFDVEFRTRVRWQGDLLAGFEYQFLPGAPAELPSPPTVDNAGIAAALDEFDPACVITYGFRNRLSRRALRWAERRQRWKLLISDSELRQRRPFYIRMRKALTLPFFMRRIDAFLTVGDCNEHYYARYGAPAAKFYRSPFPVDEAALANAYEHRARHRETVRNQLRLSPNSLVVLSVGKLVPRKGHAGLLRAFLDFATDASLASADANLVIAGEGEERPELERLSRAMPGRIHLAGFVPVEQLPVWYAAADILAHTSTEDPHPLAIAEAIYCGLPLIVSDRIGCVGASDDARPGINAIEVRCGDRADLSAALKLLVADPLLRARMGEASRTIARSRGMKTSVEGIVSAVFALTGAAAPAALPRVAARA